MMDTSRDEYQRAWSLFEAGDHGEAFRIFLSLAEEGSPAAQDFVGWMYFGGFGTTEDLEEARRWFQRAADAGYPWGQYHLAVIAFHEQDYRLAREWLERAAEQGHIPAIYRLGILYLSGQGVAVDEEKGLQYLTQASQRGHLLARRDIARIMIRREHKIMKRLRWWLVIAKNAWDGARIYWTNPHDTRLGRH